MELDHPTFGDWLPLNEAVARYRHLGASRGRLQVAYWRGTLPGAKLNPAHRNSPLLFRAADVEHYLHTHTRHRPNAAQNE